MYCFDTSIIVDIFHGDKDLISKLSKIIESMEDIFITPITLCELYKGAYSFYNSEKEIKDLEEFTDNFELLNFEKEACKEFGKQYDKLKKIGKMTEESDLMIASIAKANGLVLVTRNKKHFENIDIKIEVW